MWEVLLGPFWPPRLLFEKTWIHNYFETHLRDHVWIPLRWKPSKITVFIHGYYYMKCCWLMPVMCLCSWIPTWMKSSSPELSPPWASRWWTCGLYVTKWQGKSEVHLHLFFLFHITWHWLGFCHPGVPWGTALWRWRTKPQQRGAFAKSMGNPYQEPVRYAQALLRTVVAFLVCCINV